MFTDVEERNSTVRTPPSLHAKLVGGNDASEGQFPYQVSLRNPANTHFCGGTIIHKSWVMTAAHCSEGKTHADILACVGSINKANGGFAHKIAKIVPHPLYNKVDNDIALLETEVSFIFTSNVLPVSMHV